MAAYARVGVARSGAGWTVSGNTAVLVADAVFPAVAVGSSSATYFGIGVALSGAGQLLFSGLLTPPVVIAPGVTPHVAAGSGVTENPADGMPNGAATDLLNAIFTNTAWALVSAALGTAGSFYISLHTADPTPTGTQATNEVSYT